jgi:hypothetical protein
MATEFEAVAGTSKPPASRSRGIARKWLRRLAWLVAGTAICALIFAAGLVLWWFTCLRGLPDIGDPFDVAAFREFRLADDQNAFVGFRNSAAKLTPFPELTIKERKIANAADWLQVTPSVREWVLSNRPALELFLHASRRPDALFRPVGEYYSAGWYPGGQEGLACLPLLEANRLERTGDMGAAWTYYEAVLRMITHLRRRGGQMEHRLALNLDILLRARLATWASDARTTPAQRRAACGAALANKPRTEWDAFCLKVDYLDLKRILAQPLNITYLMGLHQEWKRGLDEYQIPPDIAVYLFATWRYLMREPERTERIAKHLYANWLARLEYPAGTSQKPVVKASLAPPGLPSLALPIYPVNSGALENIRVMEPDELARWVLTSIDGRSFLNSPWTLTYRDERYAHRQLVLMLAAELYRAEHGAYPTSDDKLVGTYLEVLPDDGMAVFGDASVPMIDVRARTRIKPFD